MSSEIGCHWNLFGQPGYEHEKRKGLTKPIPDWMVAFPACDDLSLASLEIVRDGRRRNSPNSLMMAPFSHDALFHLARHGLHSQVANSFAKQRSGMVLDIAEYKCFPWLVVEHKGSKKKPSYTAEHCYSQTANGTSAAILLLQNLCKYEVSTVKNYRRLPPVIGISTVSSEIKVWVTHATSDCIVSEVFCSTLFRSVYLNQKLTLI